MELLFDFKQKKVEPVTKGRLNKMCKYFRGKAVHIEFEYNNSLGHHWVREAYTLYDEFLIHEVVVSGFSEYTVSFKYKGTEVFLQEFPGSHDAEFVGLGRITWLNSGPYCYFRITKSGIVATLVTKTINLLMPNRR